jgi:protein SCO1/2
MRLRTEGKSPVEIRSIVEARPRRLARVALLTAALVVAVVAALVAAGRLPGVLVVGYLDRARDAGLPVYGEAPVFAMVDQSGRPVRSEDLRGRVVVTNFIYTSCPDVCPVLSARMAALAARLRDAGLLGTRVAIVSVSVDPERDTPEVLRAYAARFGADGEAWRFLTGDPAEVRTLLVEGFKVPAQPVTARPTMAHGAEHAGHDAPAGPTVLHSNKVVVVDPAGRVRGYYDGLDPDPAALLRDLRRLANASRWQRLS